MSAEVHPGEGDPLPPPAWDSTKVRVPMSHDEWSLLHKQCKALAYAHHVIFRPAPAKFICCFLDKDFVDICDQFQDSEKKKWCKSILTFAILLFLPMGYGYAVMSYPCDPVAYRTGDNSTALSTKVMSKALQCETEDFLRSWDSLYLGPTALVVSFALWIANLVMAAGCTGCRSFGTKLYTFQTNYVRPHLSALTIQPSRGPGSYEWPMCVYYAFLLEMIFVGVMLQSGLAVLVGIGAANLFLSMCNGIYGISAIFGAMVAGELAAVPILGRLWGANVITQSTYASINDLQCLWEIRGECALKEVVENDSFPMGLGAMVRMHDPHPRWRQPFKKLPLFVTEVYLPDRNATVNLIKGEIKCQGKPVWSEANGLVETNGDDKKTP